MPITSKDIVPLKEMRARLTELADEACAGREKIITRNGKAYVALIDARRLDYYHRLERENIHLGLLDEATRGWDDVEEGNLLTGPSSRAVTAGANERRHLANNPQLFPQSRRNRGVSARSRGA